MNSPYIKERNQLINRLIILYPYSREWFESKATAVLVAMYCKAPKQETRQSLAMPIDVKRRYNMNYGYYEVLTDSGMWEEEIN